MVDPYPLLRPWLFRLDPERAHEWTLRALEAGIVPRRAAPADPILAVDLFGRRLAHPIGLAAGFDKDARVFNPMFGQGFAFVEVGGVTPRPQGGNPRPRVFRLREDRAVINRMGFPSAGVAEVVVRLARHPAVGLLGVNLAANAQSADPVADFVALVERLAQHAGYLTLDISCPNTANGRVFLDPARLRELLAAIAQIRLPFARPPLVAKLSPDIEPGRLRPLLDALLGARIDGIIVANTTAARPALVSRRRVEPGGLSGRPLFAASTALLERVAGMTGGSIPLIGAGGIANGADAYAKIRAGASAIQLYTALVYDGPALIARVARELAALLRRDGFTTLAQAVAAG